MLHALTDKGMDAVHFLLKSQYPGDIGKFIYKPAIYQIRIASCKTESIKKPQKCCLPQDCNNAQHVLWLTETKRSSVHVLLMTTWPLDKSTRINCVVCKLKKSIPSDLQSQLQVTRKVTRQFTQRDSTEGVWCASRVLSAIAHYQRYVCALASNTQAYLQIS